MMKYSTFDITTYITNLKLEFPWRSPATDSFALKNINFSIVLIAWRLVTKLQSYFQHIFMKDVIFNKY